MRIKKIILKNFRGFSSIEVPLNSSFNLIVGDNGSGKTALLEGLTVAMGSFFLGIQDTDTRGIRRADIHIKTFEGHEEYQFPVRVEAEGVVNGGKITWARTLNGEENRTTSSEASTIKQIAVDLDRRVRNGEQANLPLLTYYSTGRLFNEFQGETNGRQGIASRFRAYNRCLDAKSTYNFFARWYRGKELARIQKGRQDIALDTVKEAIVRNIPDCANIFHEFDPDRGEGLKMEMRDGRTLPFRILSDGTRNFFAIVADLAYKCVTLNPHFGAAALAQTQGMVLIDELDLHLHPEWQRKIVSVLKNTFPRIQFVASSHSPFLIQEMVDNQLIILENNGMGGIGSGVNRSIEDIAEDIQHVRNPQWSQARQLMFEKARAYYQALKDGTATQEMKDELDKAMMPFSQDTAYHALLEQERIIREHRNNQHP